MLITIILVIAEKILPSFIVDFLRRLLVKKPDDGYGRIRDATEAVKKMDTSEKAVTNDPNNRDNVR